MDADYASGDRIREKISKLWRPLPWRERIVYVLTILLFVLAFLLQELTDHLPAQWVGDGTLNLRLPQIEILLLIACFPMFVATFVLAMRRWRPEEWREFRRLWSVRAVLVGLSVVLAFGAWDIVIELAAPADQIPPNLPSFLAVPFVAAAGRILVGMVLAPTFRGHRDPLLGVSDRVTCWARPQSGFQERMRRPEGTAGRELVLAVVHPVGATLRKPECGHCGLWARLPLRSGRQATLGRLSDHDGRAPTTRRLPQRAPPGHRAQRRSPD